MNDLFMLSNVQVGIWWARRSVMECGWRRPRSAPRPFTNVWYIESGEMGVSFPHGALTRFRPRTLAFIPPDVRPTTWNDGPGPLSYLSLGCSLSAGGIDLMEGTEPTVVECLLPDPLVELWLRIGERIASMPADAPLSARLRVSGWVRELLAGLLEVAGLNPLARLSAIDPRVRDAVRWMEMNLTKSPTIEEAAAYARVSPSHLGALFRSSLGVSWRRHLMRMRVQRAKQLLVGSEKTIAEIATEVGYSNAHHFSRAFTRWERVPPNKYRESILRQLESWRPAAAGEAGGRHPGGTSAGLGTGKEWTRDGCRV